MIMYQKKVEVIGLPSGRRTLVKYLQGIDVIKSTIVNIES